MASWKEISIYPVTRITWTRCSNLVMNLMVWERDWTDHVGWTVRQNEYRQGHHKGDKRSTTRMICCVIGEEGKGGKRGNERIGPESLFDYDT